MKILKTSCIDCNNLVDHSCSIDIPIFEESNQTYTKGYCSFKSVGATNRLNYITVVILARTNNTSGIIKTIGSINNELVKEVVIITNYATKDQINYLYSYLKDSNIAWSIENMSDMGEMTDIQFTDYCQKLISPASSWFITVKEGEEIDARIIEAFNKAIDSKKNILLFLGSADYPYNMLINKYAFQELWGNHKITWLEKILGFDNWRDSCLKIQ